jgi:predicted  nucleic acid-binding Zn-ribbon protein
MGFNTSLYKIKTRKQLTTLKTCLIRSNERLVILECKLLMLEAEYGDNAMEIDNIARQVKKNESLINVVKGNL